MFVVWGPDSIQHQLVRQLTRLQGGAMTEKGFISGWQIFEFKNGAELHYIVE